MPEDKKQDESKPDDQPKAVTAEDVQTAVGVAMKKFRTEVDKSLKAMLAEALKKPEPGEEAEPEPEKKETATSAQLRAERTKRENLEKRVNELIAEGQASAARAEQADRYSQIRAELAAAGVVSVEDAFGAIRDGVARGEDGKLFGKGKDESEIPLKEYVAGWVKERPHFLPARVAGGSGAAKNQGSAGAKTFTLDDIKPGADNLNEIAAHIAAQLPK